MQICLNKVPRRQFHIEKGILGRGAEDKLVIGARNGFSTTVKDLRWQDVRYYEGDVIDCEGSDLLKCSLC